METTIAICTYKTIHKTHLHPLSYTSTHPDTHTQKHRLKTYSNTYSQAYKATDV